jgi:O-acetyl-ADP-ribose deacetylase (regulator of RNase III)
MMEFGKGNMLDADVQALVNTVNTVGIMGKGIALQFKKAFPENFDAYAKACKRDEVQIGRMFIYDLAQLQDPRFIINFPTKRHWRGRSKLEDIEAGLEALVKDVKRLRIESLALPPLGCGHGGLVWEDVYPMIVQAFRSLPDVRVVVYAPGATPAAETMPNKTKRPNMTIGRATILGLIQSYSEPGYDYPITVLEIQKLAYFQQFAGEPLEYSFERGAFGPYADELRHVLNRIEGHFIQGFADGQNKPDTAIKVLEEAVDEAKLTLKEHTATQERIRRVARLIEGFETPFGMELLSSVHWIAVQENARARTDVNAAIAGVHNWNERKRRSMHADHIRSAWQRLHDQGWI